MLLHTVRTSMRSLLATGTVLIALASGACAQTDTASGVPLWKTLPPTPVALSADANGLPVQSGHVRMDDGAKIYCAQAGEGEPVLLLHGGLANSDYMSDLARALLAAHYQVIVVDSRGHGRSSLGRTPIGYDRMADDAVAVLTHLKIERAAVVGWSDGGIQGIDLALRHPDRITRVFSFAPNITTDGVDTSAENTPTVKAFIARTKQEYRHLSPSPGRFGKFEASIEHMWSNQPNWSDAQVATITTPMWIVDGDHDEMIHLPHIQHIAQVVPQAGLLILPNTSHFAFLQNPELFSETVINFLKLPTP
ncbi:alpha/beta hydrolase [Acetobacter sicerae]|uniref:Alpha/beta hydrolase n=1 Tax=Acetobacter sicerae TaxID=85325 RepID=A0ABS8VXW0_9PROT|nr:alpha/beta hydrolase [Acetobacter sicerae]MCE0743301.1 alpha/beta hydrolase [Acetobacter sicerae]